MALDEIKTEDLRRVFVGCMRGVKDCLNTVAKAIADADKLQQQACYLLTEMANRQGVVDSEMARRCTPIDPKSKTHDAILFLHGQGVSNRDIANTLNSTGRETAFGNRWSPNTVRQLITAHKKAEGEQGQ